MQRNKLIYALADAALVVNADYEKGGTWTGAVEQLDRLHFVPVFVRSNGITGKALDALQRKGALPWPNPATPDEFAEALSVENDSNVMAPLFEKLRYVAKEPPVPDYVSAPETTKTLTVPTSQPSILEQDLGTELYAKVRELLQRLPAPCSEAEIATILNVSKNQAKEWLARSVQEGWGEKSGKPIRYHFCKEKHPDLFGG